MVMLHFSFQRCWEHGSRTGSQQLYGSPGPLQTLHFLSFIRRVWQVASGERLESGGRGACLKCKIIGQPVNQSLTWRCRMLWAGTAAIHTRTFTKLILARLDWYADWLIGWRQRATPFRVQQPRFCLSKTVCDVTAIACSRRSSADSGNWSSSTSCFLFFFSHFS